MPAPLWVLVQAASHRSELCSVVSENKDEASGRGRYYLHERGTGIRNKIAINQKQK